MAALFTSKSLNNSTSTKTEKNDNQSILQSIVIIFTFVLLFAWFNEFLESLSWKCNLGVAISTIYFVQSKVVRNHHRSIIQSIAIIPFAILSLDYLSELLNLLLPADLSLFVFFAIWFNLIFIVGIVYVQTTLMKEKSHQLN